MLTKKIDDDFKTALKQRDKLKGSILSFLRSELNYLAIDKRKKPEDLEDNDVILVLRRLVKQHHDSIEQFKKGNRPDLVEKETKELEILKSYLPQEITLDELNRIIEETIVSSNAKSPKDMGCVMKELMSKIGGMTDNSLVSRLVRERLQAK